MQKADLLVSTSTIEVSSNFINYLQFWLSFPSLKGLFWKAPELLRSPHLFGSQKGDVYAFSIILYEVCGRKGPFGNNEYEPKEIIDLVRDPKNGVPFRPDVESILEMENVSDYVISCIQDCWTEIPLERPDFPSIR